MKRRSEVRYLSSLTLKIGTDAIFNSKFIADFTAATILDKFQNQQTAAAVERVLKVLSTKEAKQMLEVSLFECLFQDKLLIIITS